MKKCLSEDAIKDRLRNLASEQGKSVNELLKKLYLERFLARLAKSDFKNQLIFKGGYLLRYYIKNSFYITVLKVEPLDHPHMTYPGFRITLKIKHTEGTLKDNLQIDIGVGDVVNARALAMSC